MKSLHWMICVALTACGGDAVSTSVGNHPTQPPKDTTTTTPAAKPGSPRSATVVGDPLVSTVASALNVALRVTDSVGLPVPAAVVNFVVTAGGGSVFAPAVATSTLGIANQQWTLGTKAGVQSIEARWIDPETGAARVLGTISATASAGPLAKLTFGSSTQVIGIAGSTIPIDTLIAWNFGVRAGDQYGNVLTSTNIAYGTDGPLALNASTVSMRTTGTGHLTATAGNLTAQSGDVYIVDDLRAKWRASYACFRGLGLGNGDDSVTYEATGTAVYANGTLRQNGVLGARIPATVTVTNYQIGNQKFVQTFTDTLIANEQVDKVDFNGTQGKFGGAVSFETLHRASAAPLVYTGTSWCSAAQWASFRALRLEALP